MNIAATNQPTNQPTPKRRIGYIDALRGFTMILVVVWHILLYSNINCFPFTNFFSLFRMPLFFFISGFILYKNSHSWTLSNTAKFISKKFLVQIIPTIIFLSAYLFIFSPKTINHFYYGYWFTITLFEYFVIYSLFHLLLKNEVISNILLLFCSIFLYTTVYLSSTWAWFNINLYFYDYFVINFEFFIFFIIGIFAKKHFNKITLLFNNHLVMATSIALLFIGAIIYLNGYCREVKLALSILGIFSIFYFFMKNGEYMDNSRVGKTLQFIGRRTLDIYLLHYFFVNGSISWVKNLGINSPTIIFVISILTSFVIIGICLLISKFLRTNPLLGKILFGAKMPAKIENN